MGSDMFAECAPVAWQLLLEADRELSSCAAALFILAAVKAPGAATHIMHDDLKHGEPSTRYVRTCSGSARRWTFTAGHVYIIYI